MGEIKSFLTQDHRECDELFSKFEECVSNSDWSGAEELYGSVRSMFLSHFDMEEQVAFPLFNKSAGGGCNPTSVMIGEHEQMRMLLNRADSLLKDKNRDTLLSLLDAFMITVQQHNMKEENIMYMLLEQTLGGSSSEVLNAMKSIGGR